MGGQPKRYAKGGVTCSIGTPVVVELPPRIFRLRLRRALFDPDRTFLRPESLHSIKMLCRFYDEYRALNVVLNGHTDTDYPDPNYNLKLSEQRAAAIGDYLQDKVDGWLAWYKSAEWNKKWGVKEDQHMLSHLKGNDGAPYLGHPATGQFDGPTLAALKKFQAERLPGHAQGTFDDDTRRELVRLYMAEDETTLPSTAVITAHGCGLYNLEVQTGPNVSNQANRRVEVFLFEDKVDPPAIEPCAKAGCPYHKWKDEAVLTVDLDKEPGALRIMVTSDGKYLEGVTVTAAGPETLQTVSGPGEQGAVFKLLVPGSYKLSAAKPGFKSVSDGNSVTVSEGGETVDFMAMVALGELRVKAVRSFSQKPIAGATITVKGPTEPKALGQSVATEQTGKTNGDGVATFKELEVGSYEIVASAAKLSFDKSKPVTAKVEAKAGGNDATVELYQELTFKVLTYNVMFVPTIPFFQNQKYYNPERRGPLATKVLGIDADIVTFDELFENSSREAFLALIADKYGNQSSVVDRGSSVEDGGVVVVSKSKHPLQDMGHLIYKHDADTDHLAAKGIKYAIVTIEDQRIHVFATHTQADYWKDVDEKVYPSIRSQQFVEARDYISKQKIPLEEPILFCGDLNVDVGATAWFDDMIGTLSAKWTGERTGWPYTNDEIDNDLALWRARDLEKRKKRVRLYYDYILPIEGVLKNRIVPTTQTLETLKPRADEPITPEATGEDEEVPTFSDLSDHYALLSVLTYRF